MLSRLTVPKMGKDKQEDASHNRDIDYTIHALSFSLFLLFLALIIYLICTSVRIGYKTPAQKNNDRRPLFTCMCACVWRSGLWRSGHRHNTFETVRTTWLSTTSDEGRPAPKAAPRLARAAATDGGTRPLRVFAFFIVARATGVPTVGTPD